MQATARWAARSYRLLGTRHHRSSVRAISFVRTAEEYAAERAEPAEDFWMRQAAAIDWTRPPSRALDGSRAPFYRWFPDGVLNVCHNAIDRHLAERAAQTAIAYDSAVGGLSRNISFGELHADVARFAGALARLGVGRGDRVLLYMPMVPEAIVAMLGAVRLGAVHSVVFGGFAARELAVRIEDAAPKVVVTASCGLEKGSIVHYRPLLERALALSTHTPEHIIVHQRPEAPEALAPLSQGSHGGVGVHEFREAIAAAPPHDPVPLGANDPLYTLYTSGTTGDPKGILRDQTHAVALQWSMPNFMGVRAGETYWAASDIGWVVGHSYIVYAPLINGSTTVLYEGKPVGTPDAANFWRVVQRHKVSALFAAPTALRAIRKLDPNLQLVANHDISSLRTLFVAGERCDPDTAIAFEQALGLPVVDNWWQTETGWPIGGLQLDGVGTKPGSTSLPLPGYDVQVFSSETKQPLPRGSLGSLAIRLPLPPGTMQTLYNNDARCERAYFEEFPGWYSAGDAGVIDDDGYIHVMARTDDVINCAGHRLSTGGLEEVISAHADVAECAVVGANDELKGQVPLGLLVLNAGCSTAADTVVADVIASVREEVGPVASFRRAAVVEALPKTRSGKTLRGIIQSIANGAPYKLPGTIEDEAPVAAVQKALRSIGYPEEDGSRA